MKIVDIVKFNDGYAYVIDEEYKITYEKYEDILIGTDSTNTFYDVLLLEYPKGRREYGGYAFGGSEFDVDMKDGTKTHCWGQCWSGGFSKAEEKTGVEIVGFVHNTVEQLQKCYVFFDGYADKQKLIKLVGDFYEANPYYRPYEYEEYRNYLPPKGDR